MTPNLDPKIILDVTDCPDNSEKKVLRKYDKKQNITMNLMINKNLEPINVSPNLT